MTLKNLDGLEYSDAGGITLIAVGAIAVILGIFGIGVWIKYSWIRRTNSKNLTGLDVTKKILEGTPLENVQIKKSMMYAKYWNHNKKRGTYRLRPWTHDRQSLYTIMEATAQAYASAVRETKSKEFWWLFRLPSIIRFAATAVAIVSAVLLINNNAPVGILVAAVIGIVAIPFLIAQCGALYVLMKNTMPLIKSLGLTDEEVKSIHKIFVFRFVFAVIATILDLIRLAVQLSEASAKARR